MANIQSSINQMISLTGLLASQVPAFKAGAEKRAEISRLGKKEQAITKAIETAADTKDKEAYAEELTKVKKQQFEVNPTEESYKAYYDTMPHQFAVIEAEPYEIAQELYETEQKEAEVESYLQQFRKADTHRAEAQAAKMETRRRILEGTPSEYLMRGGM